jgi:hypothetical protein
MSWTLHPFSTEGAHFAGLATISVEQLVSVQLSRHLCQYDPGSAPIPLRQAVKLHAKMRPWLVSGEMEAHANIGLQVA